MLNSRDACLSGFVGCDGIDDEENQWTADAVAAFARATERPAARGTREIAAHGEFDACSFQLSGSRQRGV